MKILGVVHLKNIGLITYHSAYNFGSVLQAYATQNIIEQLNNKCEVINYRTNEQKRVYSIFKWDQGIKSIAKNILKIPSYKKSKVRELQYEDFIKKYLNCTDECTEPEDVYSLWNKYDVVVSGSDQIWNKRSNELKYVSWNYMMPYLLVGFKGKKVSYASSPTTMTNEELEKIVSYIREFDSVSFREKKSADELKQNFAIESKTVLDPTFLLSKDEWATRLGLRKNNEPPYVLYYCLNNHKTLEKNKKIVAKIAKRDNLKVKMIAPLSFLNVGNSVVDIISDVGPIDFLNLIYNAKKVITDSYHGTILSVNFQKDIYSICSNHISDMRKVDILNRLDLSERIIYDLNLLLTKKYETINYNSINQKIEKERTKSVQYLKDVL